MSISDQDDGFGYFKPLTFLLGVNPDAVPIVMYTTMDGEKYMYQEPSITK